MYAPAGRPREFTYSKRRELLDHIGQGSTVEEAAQIVGVTLRTVQRAAKFDEFFHHDLQLALHAAPVDPYKLVARAARSHWRAAAWLLERQDPDRYGKRQPNSCRPEMLQEVSDWLIETALETVSPDQREAVYSRMRGVADKACTTLMPAQHDARRALQCQLPNRPMPLSELQWQQTLGVVSDNPNWVAPDKKTPVPSPLRGGTNEHGRQGDRAQAVVMCEAPGRGAAAGTRTTESQIERDAFPLPPPSPQGGGSRRLSNGQQAAEQISINVGTEQTVFRDAQVAEDGNQCRPPTQTGGFDIFSASAGELVAHLTNRRGAKPAGARPVDPATIADPIAYYRAHPPAQPPAERRSDYVNGFRLLDSERMDHQWQEHLAEQGDVIDFGAIEEKLEEESDVLAPWADEDDITGLGESSTSAGGVSDGESWAARPRSAAGCSELAGARRGALDEISAAPTTPRADLGVPPGGSPAPHGPLVGENAELDQPAPSHPPIEGNMSLKIHSATSAGDAPHDVAASSAADRVRDLWEWRFRGTGPSSGEDAARPRPMTTSGPLPLMGSVREA